MPWTRDGRARVHWSGRRILSSRCAGWSWGAFGSSTCSSVSVAGLPGCAGRAGFCPCPHSVPRIAWQFLGRSRWLGCVRGALTRPVVGPGMRDSACRALSLRSTAGAGVGRRSRRRSTQRGVPPPSSCPYTLCTGVPCTRTPGNTGRGRHRTDSRWRTRRTWRECASTVNGVYRPMHCAQTRTEHRPPRLSWRASVPAPPRRRTPASRRGSP